MTEHWPSRIRWIGAETSVYIISGTVDKKVKKTLSTPAKLTDPKQVSLPMGERGISAQVDTVCRSVALAKSRRVLGAVQALRSFRSRFAGLRP